MYTQRENNIKNNRFNRSPKVAMFDIAFLSALSTVGHDGGGSSQLGTYGGCEPDPDLCMASNFYTFTKAGSVSTFLRSRSKLKSINAFYDIQRSHNWAVLEVSSHNWTGLEESFSQKISVSDRLTVCCSVLKKNLFVDF